MKRSDYQSLKQAKAYEEKRFIKGLKKVNSDELALLNSWVAEPNITKSLSFADIGSGTGRVLGELLQKQPKIIYAVDQSKAMLAQLQEIYKKEVKSKKIRVLLASSDNTGLKSDSVDGVTAFHLFKHLEDINPTIKEVSRILKRDGFFVFEALNRESLIRFNLGTCYAFSTTQLLSSLSKHGFFVKRVSYLHPLGETVYNFDGDLGTKLIDLITTAVSTIFPKLGTKIFILAQKQ